jgi:hypothetical protein
MSLWEKFWARCLPLTASEKAVMAAEAAWYRAQEEAIRAETQRVTLANQQEQEDQERSRRRREYMNTVGVYEYQDYTIEGKKILTHMILSQNELGSRKLTLECRWRKSGAEVENMDLQGTWGVISGTREYQLFLKPWMDGTLQVEDLLTLKEFMIPGLIPGSSPKTT